MFTTKPTEKSTLENEIDSLLDRMGRAQPHTDAYAAMADQVVKLYPLIDDKSKKRISPDTLVTVAANLAGIMLIIHHEKVNVISSKALSFIHKLQ